MAKAAETTDNESVATLFEKATTDPEAVARISRYVKTGRRWDVTHKELVDEVIVLLRAKEIQTKYGAAWLCDIEHQGEKKTALMGGQVLRDQIADLGVNLPVICVIKKPARSYGFFDPTPEQLEEYKKKYL